MRLLIIVSMCFGCALCADASLSDSDFVERLINFVIFIAILWYLSAEKIKTIFSSRTQEIALSFERVQDQNKVAEKEKEKALKHLSEAEDRANEIIALARREAMFIAQQYREKVDRDIRAISLSFEQTLKQEEKHMLREGIQRVLSQSAQQVKAPNDADFYLKVLSGRIN